MRTSTKSGVLAAAAVVALTGVPMAIVTISPAGAANADVCASAGRRITVSGCTNVAENIADYAPPPAQYAPLPEDFTPNSTVCVGWNGRWVNAGGCTP